MASRVPAAAAPRPRECLVGLAAHYAIGISFALSGALLLIMAMAGMGAHGGAGRDS